jgi:GR25 family glycosyltransferase involved in LPS biosynthesis
MVPLDVVYLNLGNAVARRQAFEEHYAALNLASHWSVRRFHAIDAQHDLVKNAEGSLPPGGKGCYFSSLECLRQTLTDDRHLYLLDDDIRFGPSSQALTDHVLSTIDETQWDVIYTDSIISNAFDMPRLMMAWKEYQKTRRLSIIGLKSAQFNFCAGTAIYNRRSKQKILDCMTVTDFSVPWDLMIRHQIRSGNINAILVFPFLTTVSSHGDVSQLSPQSDMLEHSLYNQFRRLVFVDRGDEPDTTDWSTHAHADVLDDEAKRFSKIFLPLLSLQFRWY